MQDNKSEMSIDIGREEEKEVSFNSEEISLFFNTNSFILGNNDKERRSSSHSYRILREHEDIPLPSGLIPRIEYSKKHLEFLSIPFGPPYIMLNMDVVEKLTDKGLTANEIYPYGKIITTSTIHDDILCNFTVKHEIDIITKFDPAWHIPCDYPTYFEDSDEGREWFIDASIEDTLSFIEATDDTSIRVIPLVKGINAGEWKRSISPFQNRGINHFAFYVKQYFGRNNGKNDKLMVEHIRCLIHSCDPNYLMLIGYQSQLRVQDIPPEVQAFAGERWIRGSKMNNLNSQQARLEYQNWRSKFEVQEIVRQTVLKIKDESLLREGD